MNENRKLPETELKLVDLGDATEETKQFSPTPLYPDSLVAWGEWG